MNNEDMGKQMIEYKKSLNEDLIEDFLTIICVAFLSIGFGLLSFLIMRGISELF